MIKYRPHHFLCTIGFQGRGYSPEFVDGFQKIADQLKSPDGDLTEIQIVDETDSICEPCPNRRGALCTTQEKITRLDRQHAQVLEWKIGEILTWRESKERIKSKLTLDQFHKICNGCEWKALGVCEEALEKLLKE